MSPFSDVATLAKGGGAYRWLREAREAETAAGDSLALLAHFLC